MTRPWLQWTSVLCWLAVVAAARGIEPDEPVQLAVGVAGTLEGVVLPGPKLVARPGERTAPLVVRIDAAYPHGTAWRYDLTCFGFEPGEYDATDYLVRADGSPAGELPPVRVVVYSVLPADRATPRSVPFHGTPRPGHYRMWLVALGAAWVVGLAGLLLAGRIRRSWSGDDRPEGPTLADRLRPLVYRAQEGELTSAERAELERLLITFWQRKLELHDAAPAELMAALRSHEEAGVLLRQLEEWLHRPEPRPPADLESLLAPYRHVREPEPAHDT